MTDDEIMRQLGQAVPAMTTCRPPEDMVEVGQQQHPEWDWPLLATVLQASASWPGWSGGRSS